MKDVKTLVKQPLFFERNRVYRIYRGGAPYKEIFSDGYDDGKIVAVMQQLSKAKKMAEPFAVSHR